MKGATMPKSFLQKVSDILKGKLNDLADTQLNTVAGCRQQIRDAEMQLSNLRAAIAENDGTLTGYHRHLEENAAMRAQKTDDMQLLAKAGKLSEAQQISGTLDALDANDDATHKLLAASEARKQKLTEALQVFTEQLDVAKGRLQELELAENSAQAATAASEAVKNVGGVSESFGSTDVGGIRETILHKQDVADAKLDQALGDVVGGSNPAEKSVKDIRAGESFVSRMAALGLNPDGSPLATS